MTAHRLLIRQTDTIPFGHHQNRLQHVKNSLLEQKPAIK